MRTLLKTLCVTLALALAALALPAGAFALGQDVDINETNFPDQIFRGWLLDKGNLNGMGADGVLSPAGNWHRSPCWISPIWALVT